MVKMTEEAEIYFFSQNYLTAKLKVFKYLIAFLSVLNSHRCKQLNKLKIIISCSENCYKVALFSNLYYRI